MTPEALFAKHLPPSAGVPRVLALDARTAAALAGAAQVTLAGAAGASQAGGYDAIAGPAAADRVPDLAALLRPGGRAILTAEAEPEALLAALQQAGLIHCLVEAIGQATLYRGERAPVGGPVARVQAAAGPSASAGLNVTAADDIASPNIFLLVTQTPNKPAWKLGPEDELTWHAATVMAPDGGQRLLLAFSALTKAVAFMQAAILAGAIGGVNKVGKFPAAEAREWRLPLALNPAFEAAGRLAAGAPLAVEPKRAITGEE